MGWREEGLWRHSDFTRMLVGQSLSLFGDRITRGALPLAAVLSLDATPGQMSLLVVAQAAPVLLVGLLAGVLIDRLRRRPVLIFTDLARAVLLATIPLAALFGVLNVWQLYIVAALVAMLTIFSEVAGQAYLPSLVPRSLLVDANSRLAATSSLAEITGPAIAGGLVQIITAPFAIAIDAATFIWSALWLGQIRGEEQAPKPPAEPVSVWRDIEIGLRVVLGNPVLRRLAGRAGMDNFFGGFWWVLYDLYAIKVLGLSPALLGLLIAAGGLGALPGSLLAVRVLRRFGLGRTLVATASIGGLVGLFTPLAPVGLIAVPFLLISQFVGDAAMQIFNVNDLTLRQSIVPSSLLGRANGSMGFLVGALQPFGALLAGLLGDVIGVREALLIAAVGGLVSVLWLLSPKIAGLREHPIEADEPEPERVIV